MNAPMDKGSRPNGLSRRAVVAGAGSLVVGFGLLREALAQEVQPPAAAAPPAPPPPPPARLPGSLQGARLIDGWIKIDAQGAITVCTGKVELGQGAKTVLLQIAAEELEVAPADIRLVTADTQETPDEGYTAGSQTVQNSGTAIRHAAAQARVILRGEAAKRLGVDPASLRIEGKAFKTQDGKSVGFGELVSAELLHVEAQPKSELRKPGTYKVIGTSLPRVDIPAKVTGGAAYVHDMRPEGMLHARVVRPPSPSAKLASVDTGPVEKLPGVVKVVRNGHYLAVVAEKEFQAVKAMRALAAAARWTEEAKLPDQTRLPEFLKAKEGPVGTVAEAGAPVIAPGAKVIAGTFTRPYHMHGSIGPSCAVAQMQGDQLTVWSHTQGVFPDRKAIAEMLAMPIETIRVIHLEGSGCYGHNGADDAAADAALIAREMPGRPVRVQWTREQEHAWEPYGPPMVMKHAATLGPDGKIDTWTFDLWSPPHSSRPGPAGSLIAGRLVEKPFEPETQKLQINPNGSGDRNANPLYVFKNRKVLWHFIEQSPLRVSALRGLGAYANVFSIESFMDQLAEEAGADPVEFRLRHLEDRRARAVVEKAAESFGWSKEKLPPGRGRGFGFARYKNLAAYCAVALEIELDEDTGRIRVTRAHSAIDSGEAVNPDGIRNQTEGGINQSISWTLYEQVTFDDTRVTSIDWSSYPILRFASVPDSIVVEVIDRPGEPFLGTGEAAQGPTGGAIGNAVRNAIGKRIHDLPFTRERVKAAIEA